VDGAVAVVDKVLTLVEPQPARKAFVKDVRARILSECLSRQLSLQESEAAMLLLSDAKTRVDAKHRKRLSRKEA